MISDARAGTTSTAGATSTSGAAAPPTKETTKGRPAGPPWFSAEDVRRLVSMPDAVDAVQAALDAGLDPANDPARAVVGTSHGQLLLMPSEVRAHVGVKVASVAPDNPDHGRPRIQAVYVLMDAQTLTPVALMDGTALTALRTPAVSAVAVRRLAAPGSRRLVVFGSGPQAAGHVEALRAVLDLDEVVVVGRHAGRARAFADQVSSSGLPCRVGSAADVPAADVVVCATTAAEPLFAGATVADHACVVAVGSHERDRRELDAVLLGRSTVVVEDRGTALREAGDVVLAVAEGTLATTDLVPLVDITRGAASIDLTSPRVFKGVGMSWQDLVVAAEVLARSRSAVDQP